MRKSSLFAATMSLAMSFGVASARAQDVAGAKTMYERGMEALDKGSFDIACPSFAESHRLFPQAGTLFQWANCEDKAGKISSASTRYQLYLNDVKLLPAAKQQAHADRAKEAAARITALRDDVPTLAITLVGASPEGIIIKRDGTELSAISLGVAFPVDPGEHVVTAKLVNGRVIEQRVIVDRKQKTAVSIDVAPLASPPPPQSPPPPPSPLTKPTSGLRKGGFIALGIGGAGLIAGGIMAGLAFDKKSTFDINCPINRCNDETDRQSWYQGRTFANVATVGFGVGFAGLAIGTVMVLVGNGGAEKGPSKPGVQATVIDAGPAGAMFGMKGVFE